MRLAHVHVGILMCLAILLLSNFCDASAFVSGAYYRLGEDDPGASAGAIGNDPTKDSFFNMLDLSRTGSPHYSADVPSKGPFGDVLSMQFANSPASAAQLYGRTTSPSMIEQGYALEAWVKPSASSLNASSNWLIAYNGDPASNGFGLFIDGSNYVVRMGSSEQIIAPVDPNNWHHLAYVQSLGTSSYYYDGKLVRQSTTDALPSAASGGFWIGGDAVSTPQYLFSGSIDEVRYQSYNPIAAGAFNPTDFLITPEPGSLALCGIAATMLLMRRQRRSSRSYANIGVSRAR